MPFIFFTLAYCPVHSCPLTCLLLYPTFLVLVGKIEITAKVTTAFCLLANFFAPSQKYFSVKTTVIIFSLGKAKCYTALTHFFDAFSTISNLCSGCAKALVFRPLRSRFYLNFSYG